jgi:serine/threonine-protein kinase
MTISAEDRFVLDPSVVMTPLAELPAAVQERLAGGDRHGVALTRRRGRAPSTLIDAALGELLNEFRAPTSVVDAIIRYSRRRTTDPEAVLAAAYPALRDCVSQGYLVSADSEGARPLEVSFAPGQRVAGGTVVRCVQALEDTELHQLVLDSGVMAALKVLRPDRAASDVTGLRREALVLRHLDGRVAPRLFEEGATDGRPWLAMEWCPGVPASRAATAARLLPDADRRLLAIARRIAQAYAELHEAGVVHADVHPGNVLVASDGVRVVDFGLARLDGDLGGGQHAPRGAVPTFHDPQHAQASRAGVRPGPATVASDQFALGAMLYEILTGASYVDFALETDEMLRQIVEDPPLTFAQRGRRPWPAVEGLLARTLAKEPAARLPSTRELAQRLAAVPPPPVPTHAPLDGLTSTLASVLARARPGGEWFEGGLPPDAPRCSVFYGAAGLATALYRAAVVQADPELLTLADEWSVRALQEADGPHAFHHDDLDVTVDTVGRISPFHSICGLRAVQVLVGHARGDPAGCGTALEAFVAESRHECDNLDLTVGRAGTLLAAGLLLETLAPTRSVTTQGLLQLGHRTLAGIWAQLDAGPPVAESDTMPYLGIAHGWAGSCSPVCGGARWPISPYPTRSSIAWTNWPGSRG